jgi:hypothetical protein
MRIQTIFLAFWAVILLFAAAVAAEPAADRGKAKPIPSSSELRQAVLRYFQVHAPKDYQDGDLLTREDVEPLLSQLQKQGFPSPDAKRILESVPSASEFLPKQFATPAGREFMRKIAKYPGAYDRVDRLSRMARGRQIIQELIRGPGGEKMIQYMTTAPGGKELGKMLGNDPMGGNFNQPTGRIYTADQLLDRLEKSRDASVNGK